MMANELTIESIKKLSPKPDDIVVIRIGENTGHNAVSQFCYEAMIHGINAAILIIEDDSDLYVLDEELMALHGWVKRGRT